MFHRFNLHVALLVTLVLQLLLGCSTSSSVDPPVNDSAPDLAKLRIEEDSLLANPTLPIAVVDQNFNYQLRPADFASDWVFSTDSVTASLDTNYNPWKIESDGALHWTPRDDAQFSQRYVYGITVYLKKNDQIFPQQIFLCVTGPKLFQRLADQQILNFTIDTIGLQLDLPLAVQQGETISLHRGPQEQLLASQDLCLFRSYLIRNSPSDSLGFSAPVGVNLEFGNHPRFALLDWSKLDLFWSSESAPLRFFKITESVNVSRITGHIPGPGLISLGVTDWSVTQPQVYSASHRPRFHLDSLKNSSDGSLTHFAVHDSISRYWFLGAKGPWMSRDSILWRCNSALEIARSTLLQLVSGDPLLSPLIYLNLESKSDLGSSSNSLHLSLYEVHELSLENLAQTVAKQWLQLIYRKQFNLVSNFSAVENRALAQAYTGAVVYSLVSKVLDKSVEEILDTYAKKFHPWLGLQQVNHDRQRNSLILFCDFLLDKESGVTSEMLPKIIGEVHKNGIKAALKTINPFGQSDINVLLKTYAQYLFSDSLLSVREQTPPILDLQITKENRVLKLTGRYSSWSTLNKALDPKEINPDSTSDSLDTYTLQLNPQFMRLNAISFVHCNIAWGSDKQAEFRIISDTNAVIQRGFSTGVYDTLHSEGQWLNSMNLNSGEHLRLIWINTGEEAHSLQKSDLQIQVHVRR